VGAFEMNKILSSHIYKPEEVENRGVKREVVGVCDSNPVSSTPSEAE
jgi:hypothetical protein